MAIKDSVKKSTPEAQRSPFPLSFQEMTAIATEHDIGLHSPEAIVNFIALMEDEMGTRAPPGFLLDFANKLEGAADMVRKIAAERVAVSA
jgi:hypothetical protein